MIIRDNEFTFPPSKRKKLVDMLTKAGFVIQKSKLGDHVYISNPQKWHPKIEDHYLPLAFMRSFSLKLVNLNEEYFESCHRKIKDIYKSAICA
jgi:hypothetical protein